MFKHELGKEARSRSSKFKGIIMSRSECLFGCNRYHLQPKTDKDGKLPDGYWFDEDDVEIIGNGITQEKKKTGGPIAIASKY